MVSTSGPFAQAALEREAAIAMARVGRSLADQILLAEVVRYATAANLPEKFVRGLEVRETRDGADTVYDVVNTWTNEFGLPLAEWFDQGTANDYLIEPKVTHDDIGLSAPSDAGAPVHTDTPLDSDTLQTERDRARIEHNRTGHAVQHPSVLYWERDGERNWRRTVIHPGQPATLAIQRGLEAAQSRFAHALSVIVARQLERTAPGAELELEAEVVVH